MTAEQTECESLSARLRLAGSVELAEQLSAAAEKPETAEEAVNIFNEFRAAMRVVLAEISDAGQ